MDTGTEILSSLIVYGKYAKHIPELGRREVFAETVARNRDMHLRKFPSLATEITDAYALVAERKVLPSMRSMQFGGRGIEKINARMFNCSYMPINHHATFAESMFLLLCGCGVGYSVQRHHVVNLPTIKTPGPRTKYLIADSIEGWADAVRHLTKAYLHGAPLPRFDFSDIRPKGASLSTGGMAPGHEALERSLGLAEEVFRNRPVGSQLRPIDCHDIICHLSDAVLSGGIRRSAMIALFDADDQDMLTCKFYENFEYPSASNPDGKNAQRARANNSAVLVRNSTHKAMFMHMWKMAEASGTGEPGVFWTNDTDKHYGTNPCAEISLAPNGFCNLTELNVTNVDGQDDFNRRAWAASLIGTLQASYTDFHYLRPIWRASAERDALLGVSMTGIASGGVMDLNLREASDIVADTNLAVAQMIGINPAARLTCVKPSGTASLVLGCSSGIHAWHDHHYIRRVRLNRDEEIAKFLIANHPELLEDSIEKPQQEVIVAIPVRAPEGSQTRNESPLDLLERVNRVSTEWIAPGHRSGPNRHNVSCTVNIKEGEWSDVADWLWNHREDYSAMSCYPYYDAAYTQAPHESITAEEFNERSAKLKPVDFSKLADNNMTRFEDELACAGGACEITSLQGS
jgi:ribonucleoside-triphosphate reductase (thioredoxin)